MRFYNIAMFIFIFNLVMGFVTELGLTDAGIESIEGWGGDDIRGGAEELGEIIGENQEGLFSELNWLVENVRLVVQGMSTLVKALANATIMFPIMLTTVSNGMLPTTLIAIMTAMVWFVYFAGIVQFTVGRSFREAQ